MGALPMPFGNPSTYEDHSGVDFGQRAGTPILASGPGTVARHSTSPAGGHWIVINYYDIGEVGYAHMNDWTGCPRVGSRVKLGDLIGYVGWDGHVYPPGRQGAHVHVTKISNQTYPATIALFDTTRVVGGASPAGKPTEGEDMPLNAATDYEAFRDMLFRALKWDIRPNGAGPDWTLGPTIWERLNAIEAAAKVGVTIDAESIAAVVAAIPDSIAADVVAELSKRLQQ